jgi:hypothetical protein
MKWAEEEEARELSTLNPNDAANKTPTVTPEDEAWMEEQLARERQIYGETFGQDINEEF